MEILMKGNKKQSLIFGCFDCGCIFIANANEYTYNPYVGRSYCDCPECGAQSKGTEPSCSLCGLIDNCDFVGTKNGYCDLHSLEINKSKLWRCLGYQVEEGVEMKFKKVPENVLHDIQINLNALNAGDNDTKSCSDEKTYLLMNKLDTSFVVYLTSNKPIPRDQDIYFVAPDGTPYKAKKETLEFMSHYRIKAEFERIKEEGKQ